MRETKLQGVYEEQRGKKTVLSTKYNGSYREWDVFHSKLASTILKGATQIGIKPGHVVLYLGVSTGTTASHVADIVSNNGFVFAVDIAPRVLRELVFLAEKRNNIAPILADASQLKELVNKVCQVDIVYQDIAQRNQVEIFIKNCGMFLKNDGFCLLCVKARSIDVTKRPSDIFRRVRVELEKHFTIADYRELSPYQKDHCIFICKKK